MSKKKKIKLEDEEKETKKPSKKKTIILSILIFILFSTICLLWARCISTSGLITKEYAINTNELSENYDGFKIVHFSDLHYGSTVTLKEVKKVVKEINSLIIELNKLTPRIETLAVIGNHDYDHNYWETIMPHLNWIELDNTYKYIYNNTDEKIVFIGLDDLTEGQPDYDNAFSFLNEQEEKIYTIVLMHEPDQVDKISNYEFDLVLAGHSHLGQVRFPLIGALYTPKGSKKYFDEQYKIGNADMYINGGIGTSLLKLRFFNKPSINLYRFYTQ